MSIKTDILVGMKKSRKKYFRSDELDDFAVEAWSDNDDDFGAPPTMHGVRARLSEMTANGDIDRVARDQYTLGDNNA